MYLMLKCRMCGGPCFSPSEFFLTNFPGLCGMLNPETEGFIQSSVARAVTEAQGNLLGNLDQLISSRLDSFQDKISENQNTLADSQLSKIKNNILSNDGYSFKRKSW